MSDKFTEWAIIELFGHQRIAGRISEQQIGGCAFVRVDVPENEEQKPYTKLLGQGSIYAITVTDEKTARAAAYYLKHEPMDKWTIGEVALKLPYTKNEGDLF
jgi:hypothetical protein